MKTFAMSALAGLAAAQHFYDHDDYHMDHHYPDVYDHGYHGYHGYHKYCRYHRYHRYSR